ncbi:hypothetical protein HPB49_003899 [Dermacentor silvarum]|uniref:Uncharacterized protein n=1 Tax=Dermacentor silvarum TaxID=543639 RepID=A0ACB8DMJ7_DERSI|nr:hypothetical protein HPB49_003899 [Dermacentor silvarum]
MRRRLSHCFVPGCTTDYKSRKKNLSLFWVPKDEGTYRKWKRNIPRADNPLEQNAAVCELHFDPQFVSRHFEHIINGELVRLERNRPFLQPDAIPFERSQVPRQASAQEKESERKVVSTVCASVLDCISMRLKARSRTMYRFIVPDACVWNHVSLTSRWFYLNCYGNKEGLYRLAARWTTVASVFRRSRTDSGGRRYDMVSEVMQSTHF